MTAEIDEQEYLRALLSRLETVKAFQELTSTPTPAWTVEPGSPLAGDDAKTAPYQVSQLAWQALLVSSDHLYCLRRTLIGDQQGKKITVTMHIYAQATLLRGAYENAARAVWLLAPTSRLTRIQRRLSLHMDDNTHSDRMHELMGQAPARTPDVRKQQLVDLAAAAGIEESSLPKAIKFIGFKQMVRGAGEELADVGADTAEAVWSACSSLAHGDISSMTFLEREIVSSTGTVHQTRLTADHRVLLWMTDHTVRMLDFAIKLHKVRCAAPWQR
ncbi:hypothetical protein GXW83_02240 [Streptacidiphilus sp. PB12-B1b]|uniref:hypothetical protein n=1 Tax=Streptacidiphilus sp. PB12-B1b TaxID=2705012 RepID=UPI0015F8EE49|nr:hypothetical protein [Streptacidiphilus sp. PB12-B1b]QMU74773.1 hypothetical protein GXW83_02240 [Streptacidiphilus sp. PB12-B1b]